MQKKKVVKGQFINKVPQPTKQITNKVTVPTQESVNKVDPPKQLLNKVPVPSKQTINKVDPPKQLLNKVPVFTKGTTNKITVPIKQPIKKISIKKDIVVIKKEEPKKDIPKKFNNRNHKHQKLNLIHQQIKPNSKLVALVVTICGGSSYDQLFSSIEQKSQEGTHVLVYKCEANYISEITKGFQNKSQNPTIKQMVQNIKSLDPDCVVFNWQCCSVYTQQKFTEGKNQVMKLLQILIKSGHMAMFSDFSLKALINNWDEKILGPKCLKKVGQFQGTAVIRFDPQKLKQCPSTQLQSVGQLSQNGIVNIQTLMGTIVYTVDYSKTDHNFYKFQLLSVVPTCHKHTENLECKIKEYVGSAGHTLLTYPTGATLLTSMGHWIQLMKIDVSEKKLFQKAIQDYGEEYANQIKQQYEQFNQQQKGQYIQKKAKQFVQNRAPCNNIQRKMKKKMKNGNF